MKAICIIGSPREKGCTSLIVNAITKGMIDTGVDVKSYYLGNLNIRYCLGCMTCHKTRQCVLEDDVDLIMKDLMESDIVLVASPSYWGDITGQLKVFIDRNTPYGNTCEGGTLIPHGKIGVAVAVRAGQRQSENQHIIDTINHYYSHLEIAPVESFTIEEIMELEDFIGKEDRLEEAYILGSRLSTRRIRQHEKTD